MSGLSHENHVVYILLNHSNKTAPQQVFYISFHFCHTDINECADGTHNCDQQCHNTLGSYECSCNRNFILNYDGQACLGYQLEACNCSCMLLLSCRQKIMDTNKGACVGTHNCSQHCYNIDIPPL